MKTAHTQKSRLLPLAAFILVVIFQNCSKVAVSDLSSKTDSVAPLIDQGQPTPGTSLEVKDLSVSGPFNQPIDFNYPVPVDPKSLSFFFSNGKSNQLVTANGTYQLLDATTMKMRFTPVYGFRGQESVSVSFKDSSGNVSNPKLTVAIGNNLNILQPAIAVRAATCLNCHAQISSNYITDYGFGGDGKGRDFYFGSTSPLQGNNVSWKITWDNGNIYGDHKSSSPTHSSSTLAFKNAALKVFVPAAPIAVDSNPFKDSEGQDTLAKYLTYRFQHVNSVYDNVTSQVQVVEKQKVYIGAPTAASILSAFSLVDDGSAKMKFFKETNATPDVSGIVLDSGVFRNSGVVTCEGDLALVGNLYLENLQLRSRTGCRIYVTGSVLMYGPISYLDKTAATNLQISSARSIALGLGQVTPNGQNCEGSTSWYATNKRTSSLDERFRDQWTIPSYFMRENKSPQDIMAQMYSDALKVQSVVGTLMDASCRPETRDVAFERLLLNAPQIHSRYKGDFKGAIVAEFALMSLGNFKFEFDPVFSSNTVLPMLSESEVLSVQ